MVACNIELQLMFCCILEVAKKVILINLTHEYAKIGSDPSPHNWWPASTFLQFIPLSDDFYRSSESSEKYLPWAKTNQEMIVQCHGKNSVSCCLCCFVLRLLQFGAAPLPFSQLAAGWKFMDKLQKGWVLWIPPMNTTPPNVAFRYIFIPMSLALGSSVPLMPGIGSFHDIGWSKAKILAKSVFHPISCMIGVVSEQPVQRPRVNLKPTVFFWLMEHTFLLSGGGS